MNKAEGVLEQLNLEVKNLNKDILEVDGKITNASKKAEELKEQLRDKVITSIFLGVMAALSVGMVLLGGITATVIIGLGIEFAGVSLTAIFAIVCMVTAMSLVMGIIFWIIFGRRVSKIKGNKESVAVQNKEVGDFEFEKKLLYQKKRNLIVRMENKVLCRKKNEGKNAPLPIPDKGKRKVPNIETKGGDESKNSPETEEEKLKRLTGERQDQIEEHKFNHGNVVNEFKKI